ncbi:hypothetical protein Tco_0106200, partial [Tanacetum coccineum]
MLLITRGAKLDTSFFQNLSSTTSFSNAVTLLLNWKTDAKFGSSDKGFIASVVSGGVGIDYGGGGAKDGNDCGMTVMYIGEDSVITKT